VAMPVTAVSEALSKSVIDGALMPYDVVPSVKVQDLVRFHADTDPSQPAIYTATFVFAMNQARYNSLPPHLQKVIDANSGQALSGQIGKVFVTAANTGRQLTARNTHTTITSGELQKWKQAAQSVTNTWVAEVNATGVNGQKLLETARQLIARHSAALVQ